MEKNVHDCTLCGYDGGIIHNKEIQNLKEKVADFRAATIKAQSGDRPWTYFWVALTFIGLALIGLTGFDYWLNINHQDPESAQQQKAHAECINVVKETNFGETNKLEAINSCNKIMENITLTPETASE